jgi:hypothetical protein
MNRREWLKRAGLVAGGAVVATYGAPVGEPVMALDNPTGPAKTGLGSTPPTSHHEGDIWVSDNALYVFSSKRIYRVAPQ